MREFSCAFCADFRDYYYDCVVVVVVVAVVVVDDETGDDGLDSVGLYAVASLNWARLAAGLLANDVLDIFVVAVAEKRSTTTPWTKEDVSCSFDFDSVAALNLVVVVAVVVGNDERTWATRRPSWAKSVVVVVVVSFDCSRTTTMTTKTTDAVLSQ